MEKIEEQAKAEKDKHYNKFMQWVIDIRPNLTLFNPDSTVQMQQLLFAPFHRKSSQRLSLNELQGAYDDFWDDQHLNNSKLS